MCCRYVLFCATFRLASNTACPCAPRERVERRPAGGDASSPPPPREHAYIKSRTGATKSVQLFLPVVRAHHAGIRLVLFLAYNAVSYHRPSLQLHNAARRWATCYECWQTCKTSGTRIPGDKTTGAEAPNLDLSEVYRFAVPCQGWRVLPREVAPKPRVAPTLPTLVERHLAKHGTFSPTRQGTVTRTEPAPPTCIRCSVKSTTFTGSSSVRPRVSTRVCEECVREQLTALLQLQRKRRRYLRECITRRSGHARS